MQYVLENFQKICNKVNKEQINPIPAVIQTRFKLGEYDPETFSNYTSTLISDDTLQNELRTLQNIKAD